jgi:hypothetical protein
VPSQPENMPNKADHFMDDLYLAAVGGMVKRIDDNTLLKNSHVEYGITVTRLSDGASRTVYRRFRDIKHFYHDLIIAYEEIEHNRHIKFPSSTEGWLSASSSDLYSELVIRRKMELQVGTRHKPEHLSC